MYAYPSPPRLRFIESPAVSAFRRVRDGDVSRRSAKSIRAFRPRRQTIKSNRGSLPLQRFVLDRLERVSQRLGSRLERRVAQRGRPERHRLGQVDPRGAPAVQIDIWRQRNDVVVVDDERAHLDDRDGRLRFPVQPARQRLPAPHVVLPERVQHTRVVRGPGARDLARDAQRHGLAAAHVRRAPGCFGTRQHVRRVFVRRVVVGGEQREPP
mmetsp:Transcript_5851/g.23685  ORF Transcript_5851/g.23685 Transcript_5851/m.23685 type:complete len:211 (-) Transcript_5851:278-910(-)